MGLYCYYEVSEGLACGFGSIWGEKLFLLYQSSLVHLQA